ncbi:YdcF family protein [Planosporangium thailandense]|uniref:YdcF family protein n=1 Tax=Planosporangium thailandense TaxID=765197 RepID=A0ABX0Y6Q0_9ACTN|nr:YdcF family protein [Planosporangium thailandense]
MPDTTVPDPTLREDLRSAAETLWRYHDLGHEPRRCDTGIGLGGRDLGAARVAVELFHRGMFPILVFTGARTPRSADRFPHGEAVAYHEYAVAAGVAPESILLEERATNTYENIVFSRRVLAAHGVRPRSVLLVSRPYQQRRAYATCRKQWPEVDVVCAASRQSLAEYVSGAGDAKRVIDSVVGDTQRIELYAQRGFAVPQEVPAEVRAAYERLVAAGYTGRLIS